MDWVFYLGLLLLILGATAFLGIKIIPGIKKSWNIWFVIAGLLIVTGLGASLWGGLSSLAITGTDATTSNNAPSTNSYAYSVLAIKDNANFILDENAKVFTIPEVYNSTAVSVGYTTASANFTIGVLDPYQDMRGVTVSCTTPTFYNQNVTVADSTLYTIVTKDTSGLADIRIADSTGAYQRRTRTFLLGGQSTTGQSTTIRVLATVDATSVGKLNPSSNQDITCNVAGQNWILRVLRSSTIT